MNAGEMGAAWRAEVQQNVAPALNQSSGLLSRVKAARRQGDWGCTSSGRRYYPQDPRPGDFNINDIAASLANQCRFGGHVREFYSVAEHSVHVSYECCEQYALEGLLHDASEAYLVDVPRPVRAALAGYAEMEAKMQYAIWYQFIAAPAPNTKPVSPSLMPPCVVRADECMLATEARDLMPYGGPGGVHGWALTHAALPHLTLTWPWHPAKARRRFLRRYRELRGRLTAWDRIVIGARKLLGMEGCR